MWGHVLINCSLPLWPDMTSAPKLNEWDWGKWVTGLEMKLGWALGATLACHLERVLPLIGGVHCPVHGTGNRTQALVGITSQRD